MGKKKKETYPAPVLKGTVHKPNMKKKIFARWQLYLLILTENFIFSKLSCKIEHEISIYAF